jgi:small conductance mechanosensitive channel
MNFIECLNRIGDQGIGNFTVEGIFKVLVVLIICLIAIKILMSILNRAIERLNVEKGLHNFIKSVVKIALYFIAVIIIADTLGIPITSLIAVLSVAGLAVSLAVQGSLSNLVSGIMILITKPFAVGDYIEAAGVGGTVNEMQLIYTKLVAPDNKVIFIPNSELASAKITNYTKEGKRSFEIKVGVPYEVEVKDVKKAITQAIENHKDMILLDPEPFIKISAYKESYIEYITRVWAINEKFWDAYFLVLEDIKSEFDKSDIKMSCNNLNVHVSDK